MRHPDSVNLPQVRGQDIQLRSVLGDGAAGDDDAFYLEHADNFLVGERLRLVFIFEDIGDHVLDAGIGHAVAVGCLDAGGEEVLHLENTLRRLHVLA